jgi:hypothetical protein
MTSSNDNGSGTIHVRMLINIVKPNYV